MSETIVLERVWGIYIGIILLFFYFAIARTWEGEIEFLTTGNFRYNPTPISKSQIKRFSSFLWLYGLLGPSFILTLTMAFKWSVVLLTIAIITTFLIPSIKLSIKYLSKPKVTKLDIENFNKNYSKLSFIIVAFSGITTGLYAKYIGITPVEDAIILTFTISILFLFGSWIILNTYKRNRPYYIDILISQGKFSYGKILAGFWILIYLVVLVIYNYRILIDIQSRYFIALLFLITGLLIYDFIKKFRECPPVSIKSNLFTLLLIILLVFNEKIWIVIGQNLLLKVDVITLWFYRMCFFLLVLFLFYLSLLKDYPNLRKEVYYLWFELVYSSRTALMVFLVLYIVGLLWVTYVLAALEEASVYVFISFLTSWTFSFVLLVSTFRHRRYFIKNHLKMAYNDGLINKNQLKKSFKRLGKPLPEWLS